MKLWARQLALGLLLTTAMPATAATAADGAEQLLLDKASFWRLKDRPDLARASLKKVLAFNPGQPDALYQLASLALQQGKIGDARRYLDELRQATPADPRIGGLATAIEVGTVDPPGPPSSGSTTPAHSGPPAAEPHGAPAHSRTPDTVSAGSSARAALPPPPAMTAASADSDDLVGRPAAMADRSVPRHLRLASLTSAAFVDSDAGAADTLPPAPTRRSVASGDPVAIRPRQQLAQVELTLPQPVGGYQPPVEKPRAPAQDSLQLDIERSMAQIEAESAPQVQAGLVYRGRPGQSGLSQLDEVGLPIEGRYSPWLTGNLIVSLKPVYLSAGSVSASSLTSFGTNQFLSFAGQGVVNPGRQEHGGLIAAVGYSYGPYSAQIGEAAAGFLVTNIIGSVAVQPKFLNDQLSVRIEALREPVTDSVLSYAGTRAAISTANKLTNGAFGQSSTWGGVVKSGVRVSAYYDDGNIGGYGGVGLAALTGTNVPDNGTFDASVGAYFRPYKTADDEIRLGINLVYFGYDRNLGFYSFGQGGYFSPRNFEAVAFPVEYQGRSGRWSYLGAVALGVQHFNQRQSPFFPNNAFAEQALVNLAGSGNAYYPGSVSSGIAANLRGQVDYAVNSNLSVGAAATFNNGRDYNEYVAKVYIRKRFAPPPASGIHPKPPGETP